MPWYYLALLAVIVIIAVGVAAYLLIRREPPPPPSIPVRDEPAPASLPFQAPPEEPPHLSRVGPDPLEVSLVEYASFDLVPPSLKAVAFVTGVAPDSLVRVSDTWYASRELAPAGRVCWGAVKYATYDLLPAYLRPMTSSSGPLVVGPPVPITDGRSLKFNDKTNSMHLATVGV